MNLIERKISSLEDFIRQKEFLKETHPLKYLFWEATLRCNLNCLHCGSDCIKDNASASNEIHIDKIKSELNKIAQVYDPSEITFAIIGGEPLVRKDIIEAGAFAAELGYKWGITTNGMLLDKKTIKLLKNAKLQTISVSLDGLEKEHDTLRNSPGSFRKVTGAIRNLLEDRFFKAFDVICCVNKLNINNLEEFVNQLIVLGVPAVRFVPVFSHGRASENQYLMLEKTDYRRLLAFIAKKRNEQNDIKVYLSEEGYWGPEWECVVRDDFHYCASGILIGSILYNGRVTGCPSVSRKFVEGSIFDKSFPEIWDKQFSKYRSDRSKMFEDKCGSCEHWILCEGGGFHLLEQKNLDNFCLYKKLN